MTIGENIKNIRKKANLSQKALGDKLDVSQQMIAQYESDKRKPKLETLSKIANALDVSIGMLDDTYSVLDDDKNDLQNALYDLEEVYQKTKFSEFIKDDTKKALLSSMEKNKRQLQNMLDSCLLIKSRDMINTQKLNEVKSLENEFIQMRQDYINKYPVELRLQLAFDDLNGIGKEKVVKYAEDLYFNPEYKKDPGNDNQDQE